jgi:hypothetical protein
MVPMIKSIQINEADYLDPTQFKPDSLSHFRCTFNLFIGPSDGDGMESFQLTVCSPDWLADACQKHGYVLGRHHLIVSHFDLDSITKVITKLIDRCAGETWHQVAEKLSRIAYWEFEDYQR